VAEASKMALGETFRAIARTVLLVQAAASSPTKRVEKASAASARSPCRAAGHRHVERAGRARRQRGQVRPVWLAEAAA
jgi:hypothetical protein